MAYKKIENLVIEGARIIFRNFSGKEDKFNRAGNRNFCVLIDDEKLASSLFNDGWNIKELPPREEGDPPVHYIPVSVSYKVAAPSIYMVTRKNKILLDETTVNTLDYAEIKNVDLIIQPYFWEVSGKSGIKAYLKTMYITIDEDPLAERYENIGLTDDDDTPF